MKIKKCRFCNSTDFEQFLNLGNMQPADQFLKDSSNKIINGYKKSG